jgi:hypothetical protein
VLTDTVCAHMGKALCIKEVKRRQLQASHHSRTPMHPAPHAGPQHATRAHHSQLCTACRPAAASCAHMPLKNGYTHSTSGVTETLRLRTQLAKTHAATAKCCNTHLRVTVTLPEPALHKCRAEPPQGVRLQACASSAASNKPNHTQAEDSRRQETNRLPGMSQSPGVIMIQHDN